MSSETTWGSLCSIRLHPSTASRHVQIVGIISVFFICVSIVSFCLKTHPDMRVPNIRNITVKTPNQGIAWTLDKTQTNAHEFFFYIECICNGWFTFEILVRVNTKHVPYGRILIRFWLTSCTRSAVDRLSGCVKANTRTFSASLAPTDTFHIIAEQMRVHHVIRKHHRLHCHSQFFVSLRLRTLSVV
jgi:hypothetical protein